MKLTRLTSLFALSIATVLLSGCDRFGNLALTCSGTEKRVQEYNVREGIASDVAVTVVRDWIGTPKSIHFSTRLGSNFNATYCETGKTGELIFKSPNCSKALDTVTFYPDHGKIKVYYHASVIIDWYEADLNCTKAQGIK